MIEAPGSSTVRFNDTQEIIAQMLSWGWPYKKIGARLQLSPNTVGVYVSQMAERIPGLDGPPRQKVVVWYFAHRSA